MSQKTSILDFWECPKHVSLIPAYLNSSRFFYDIRGWLWRWRLNVSLIEVWSQCQETVEERSWNSHLKHPLRFKLSSGTFWNLFDLRQLIRLFSRFNSHDISKFNSFQHLIIASFISSFKRNKIPATISASKVALWSQLWQEGIVLGLGSHLSKSLGSRS